METRVPKPATIAMVSLFALACIGVGLFFWKTFGGTLPLEAKPYEVHVYFGSEATQLTPNSDVRIAGIKVGSVVSVKPHGRKLDAVIGLRSRYAPMPADTRAIIRYKTLLGESFVELTPGTRGGREVADGGRLSPGNVQPKQTIDKLLSTFDQPTRQSLKSFVTQLNRAVRGRGEDISAILGNGAPASQDLARVSAAVDTEDPALRELVRASGRALQTIGDRQAGVRRLVSAGRDVLSATAARDTELTRAVDALPGLQTRLRATLDDVDTAGRLAKPTLQTLRGAAPQIGPALQGVAALAPRLRKTFGLLDPIVKHSGTTLPKLNGTLALAGKLTAQLAPAGRQLVPVLQFLAAYRHEVVSSLANAASATSPIISGHHGLRFMLTLNPESLYGQASQQGAWRSQPYPAPGEAIDITNGKGAISCANAQRPTTLPLSGAPACVLGQPWTFQGKSALYPQVGPNAP